ncbi:serine/threonine protein kinase [Brevibacillus sp. SYP-B805]|uniref:serine/threonine protein kinase n=1 Tax=Brevibacillus sp. SYP-B805 TaxID=1578199 RepID=UPI0013EC1635|nr:serine/threonine-protein kinase [Brevibacillus sp. SYP-B805]NGQ96333.1 serine/threonine protein kinase [Brevibacillus sp. SYP-B805]
MCWKKGKAWFHRVWTDRPYPRGTKLKDYRTTAVLGLGSYGIAYLAVHEPTGREFVLKQVKPSLRRSPKGRDLQTYEMKVLQALDHPQIPKAVERFEIGNDSFLVMTYLTGTTLEDYLFEHQATFTEREAVAFLAEVADIVRYLHQRQVIHRDVRIPNVIVREGKPYLIDFGLARFLGDKDAALHDTLDQYPPEKRIKRQVEPASDLYALGHFLLFLLYSTYTPQPGQPERPWEEELALSPEVRRMIRKLLQIDPPYRDVDQLLAEIDRYLRKTKSSST